MESNNTRLTLRLKKSNTKLLLKRRSIYLWDCFYELLISIRIAVVVIVLICIIIIIIVSDDVGRRCVHDCLRVGLLRELFGVYIIMKTTFVTNTNISEPSIDLFHAKTTFRY